MPYHRKASRPRRRTYRRRSTVKRVAPIARLIKKVHWSQEQTKCLVNDNIYEAFNTSSGSNSMEVNALTTIAKGDQVNQREGGAVHVSGVKLNLVGDNQYANTSRLFRIVVVSLKTDTLPTSTNIYMDDDFAPLATTGTQATAAQSINNRLFSVIFDRYYDVRPIEQSGFKKDIWIPIKRKLQYEFGSSTVNDNPVRNQLYLISLLHEFGTTGSANNFQVHGKFKTYFKDASVRRNSF